MHTYAYSQSIGDFRTCNSGEFVWNSVAVWQQYDGTAWQAAVEYPGKTYSPQLVTICNNATIICNVTVTDFPLMQLSVDEGSTLVLESKNIVIQEQFTLYGTLSIQSSLGVFVCNSAHVQGNIIQDYSKTISILGNAIFCGISFEGLGTTSFAIQGNLYVNETACEFSQLSIEVMGETYITTDITFTSVAGNKVFHGNVYVSNCTWTTTIGETFICNASLILEQAIMRYSAFPIFSIAQNCIAISSTFARDADFFGMFNIQGDFIVPANSSTSIENACIELQGNCDIYGTLALQDKKGVKTIYGNFSIHESGMFINNGNDRICIYGNLENYGICNNGTNGVFQLLGSNKYIRGTIQTPRLIIDGTYTNMHLLEVKSDFSGDGVLTQHSNAVLKIQSPSSPQIVADASENTVYYTRGGNQEIHCSQFYYLVAANNKHCLILKQDIEQIHRISFTKQCFVDCNGFLFTFHEWHDSLIQGATSYDRGFIIQSGAIHVATIPFQKSLRVPLFTCALPSGFAGVEILQFDETSTGFTMNGVNNEVLQHPGVPQSNSIQGGIVNNTYFIESESKRAQLTLFWHNSQQLPGFEQTHCHMLHYNGTLWHKLQESQEAVDCGNSIYAITAETTDFSPFSIGTISEFLSIHLVQYTIQATRAGSLLQWTVYQENINGIYTVLVSTDGYLFYELATIESRFFHDQPVQYSYIDTHFYSTPIVYYTLQFTQNNGDIIKYPIQSMYRDFAPFQIYIGDKTIRIQCDKKICWQLYSLNTMQVLNGESNVDISCAHIAPGVYFVSVGGDMQKIVIP